MAIIYHVTGKEQWEQALHQGFYTDPSLEKENFIHCSEAGQVEGVLQRYFSGRTDLIKLVIDTERLTSPMKYELAPSIHQEFPHVYGPINLDAVIEVVNL